LAKNKKSNFKCNLCKDSGVIEVKGVNTKCKCFIKKEITNWLSPELRVTLKKQGMKQIDTSKEIVKHLSLGFMKTPIWHKLVLNDLIYEYFKNFLSPITYALIDGDKYTEAYVNGDHLKYHEAKNLYLTLGVDNYNKTLETTIYSLLDYRLNRDYKTWVRIDVNSSELKMIDLYGDSVWKLLQDTDRFVIPNSRKS